MFKLLDPNMENITDAQTALLNWKKSYKILFNDYNNIPNTRNRNNRRRIPSFSMQERTDPNIEKGKALATDYDPMIEFYNDIYTAVRKTQIIISDLINHQILELTSNYKKKEFHNLIKLNLQIQLNRLPNKLQQAWSSTNEWSTINLCTVPPTKLKAPGAHNNESQNETKQPLSYTIPTRLFNRNYHDPSIQIDSMPILKIPYWVYGHGNPSPNDITRITSLGKTMYQLGIEQIIALENGTSDGRSRPFNYTESMVWNGLKKLTFFNRNKPEIKFIDGHHWDMQCMKETDGLTYLWNTIDTKNYNTSIHCTCGYGRTSSVILLLIIGCTVVNMDTIDDSLQFLRSPFKIPYLPFSSFKGLQLYKTIIGNIYNKDASEEFCSVTTGWKLKLWMDRINIILQICALYLLTTNYQITTDIVIPQYDISNPENWHTSHLSWNQFLSTSQEQNFISMILKRQVLLNVNTKIYQPLNII